MKRRDIVTIYDDPITQSKPEGKAKLITKLRDDFDLEYWSVKFIKDGYTTTRWIKK